MDVIATDFDRSQCTNRRAEEVLGEWKQRTSNTWSPIVLGPPPSHAMAMPGVAVIWKEPQLAVSFVENCWSEFLVPKNSEQNHLDKNSMLDANHFDILVQDPQDMHVYFYVG